VIARPVASQSVSLLPYTRRWEFVQLGGDASVPKPPDVTARLADADTARRTRNWAQVARSIGAIATAFWQLGQVDSAFHYFFLAKRELDKQIDLGRGTGVLAYAFWGEEYRALLVDIGHLHSLSGRLDSAAYYYGLAEQSLADSARGPGSLFRVAERRALIERAATIARARGETDGAMAAFRRAYLLYDPTRPVNSILGPPTCAPTWSWYETQVAHWWNDATHPARLLATLRRTYRESGTVLLECKALLVSAGYYAATAQPDSARPLLDSVLVLTSAIGDRAGEAAALAALEELDALWPEKNRAADAETRLAALASASGDAPRWLVLRIELARAAVSRAHGGHRAAAERLAALWPEIVAGTDTGLVVNAGETLALARVDAGDAINAIPVFKTVLAIPTLGVLVSPDQMARLHAGLADAYRMTGDAASSVREYDAVSVVMRRRMGELQDDRIRVQLAELASRYTEGRVLAWLAREGAIGRAASAWGALGAADEARAFALSVLRDRKAMGPIDASAGEDLPEFARTNAATSEYVGPKVGMLYYQTTNDTLVVWWIPSASGAINAIDSIAVTRVAVTRDSLAHLVRELASGLGVASTSRALRAVFDDPQDSARGFDFEMRDDSTALRPVLQRLASILIPAAVRALVLDSAEVVVYADGDLASVPFALLPVSPGTTLGDRMAVRYSVSLGLSKLQDRRYARIPYVFDDVDCIDQPDASACRKLRAWSRNAVILGNPAMPRVTNARGVVTTLPPLPRAAEEATTIAAMLGASALPGDSGSESVLRAKLRDQPPIVHLATHGIAFSDAQRVLDSFVALAPDATSDGLWTAREIERDSTFTFVAELVVLSACQSALGQPTRSEGTVGLQRALLARGAHTLVVSLWSVNDEATSVLMQRFYRHWIGAGGKISKAEALRRAQSDLRSDPRFAHPRYWAAFQVVGRY
jgi:CHAT domain-containing protein